MGKSRASKELLQLQVRAPQKMLQFESLPSKWLLIRWQPLTMSWLM